MADWQGSESITQAEHISPNKTGDNIQAKRVAIYTWNGTDWERQSSGAKATNSYAISAISETATYKYFFFEDASQNWYIMRKTLATNIFDYTKGTGGYESVYVNSTSGPSGSPTWGTYGETF